MLLLAKKANLAECLRLE